MQDDLVQLSYILITLLYVFLNRKVKKGSLLIDSSTIDPSVSKEMASAAEKMGAVFMDAPVSGGKFPIFLIVISVVKCILTFLSNLEIHTVVSLSGFLRRAKTNAA